MLWLKQLVIRKPGLRASRPCLEFRGSGFRGLTFRVAHFETLSPNNKRLSAITWQIPGA